MPSGRHQRGRSTGTTQRASASSRTSAARGSSRSSSQSARALPAAVSPSRMASSIATRVGSSFGTRFRLTFLLMVWFSCLLLVLRLRDLDQRADVVVSETARRRLGRRAKQRLRLGLDLDLLRMGLHRVPVLLTWLQFHR